MHGKKHQIITTCLSYLYFSGGGPFSGSISPLTEAVMDVVGKNVLNVMGFDLNLDSSFLHVESFAR